MSGMTGARTWTGAVLEASTDHLVYLDEATVGRLREELPANFVPPTSADVSPVDQEWAGRQVAKVAAMIHDRVRTGPGLAIVTGTGLAELTDAQLTALLYGVSIRLGRPMAQNPAGDRIVSVRDEHPADANARGYRTNKRLLMHTDAADVAGLLCLRQGSAGGGNLFANAETVHAVITHERPAILHEYYRLWEWDLRGLQRPGSRPTLSSPIYSYYDGQLSCRYASLLLREGAAGVGETLTADQISALDLFEEVAHRDDLVLRHTLGRGDSMWFDNYRVLHGREAFRDGERGEEVRHLLRTWIWLHDGPRLAPCFASPREVY